MSIPEEPLVAPMLRPTGPDGAVASADFHGFPTNPSIAADDFKLRPHLLASLVHASGLPAQSGARVDSDIYTFAPGLLADLSRHWSADYTATFHKYSANELSSTTDHDFRIVGANQSPDWQFQLTESYTVSSYILIETAKQTKQKNWGNSLTAEHKFGNLLRYQGSVGMTDLKTESFADMRDWLTEHWLHAAVSPKVDAGIGFSVGYSEIVARPNTHYEKYLGEIKWLPTDRIDVSLRGGWEDWHSLSAAVGDERNPIIQASLGWRPFDQTRIAFTESRVVANTLTGDAVTDSNNWSISLSQRLLGKLLLNLAYTRATTDYRGTISNPLSNRSDKVAAFNSSLSVVLYKYATLAATFQSSKNDTNQLAYQYDSKQYGLELQIRF